MLQLSNIKGAIQDKRSFSTSFFVSPLSKNLMALVKTRIGVVNEKVATLPFSKTIFSEKMQPCIFILVSLYFCNKNFK